jgi:trans-aconitate methyltransferase
MRYSMTDVTPNFCDILKRYEATDTEKGTDKNTSHSYGETYNTLFSEHREALSILEIGFASGGSLLAYADYFPSATIYGIDITDNLREDVRRHPRIQTYIGDAKKEETIQHYGKTYDIIIEDASHLFEDQVRHFFDYSGFVNPGGLYIIEDIPGNTIESLLRNISGFAEIQGFQLTIFDLRDKKDRWDDVLFVFKKITH